MSFRIGQGYDIHRLVEGRPLILGGITIDYEKGLLGHSDADALLHAITDALLGAAGLGDIGRHFPDTDPAYKDAELPMSALEAVNMLRNRSDVQMPPYPSHLSKEDFIKRLKNERRVELAFEGHRFWDVRRWNELEQTADIYKVQVTKIGDRVSYDRQLYETRVVEPRMYFYPISNSELFKNGNLRQNEGW